MSKPAPYSLIGRCLPPWGVGVEGCSSATHALSFWKTPAPGLKEAREAVPRQLSRCGASQTMSAVCRELRGLGRGQEAPGARLSSPPPRQTKSGLGLGSWRPSRHLGRPGGGGSRAGKAGALSNSATATAGQAAAWQLSEQEAGLEGVRDDDREGGGATVRVHLGCRWQGREGLSAK